MGVNYGKDYNYAERNLNDSMVCHEDELILVQAIDHGTGEIIGVSYAEEYDQPQPKKVLLSQVDLRPFTLGYVNYQGHAHYLVRLPSRQWRQGATRGNIKNISNARVQNTNVPLGRELTRIIKNKYPTPSAVRELMSHSIAHAVALSRTIAIRHSGTNPDKEVEVWRRGHKIGYLTEWSTFRPDSGCEVFEKEVKEVIG